MPRTGRTVATGLVLGLLLGAGAVVPPAALAVTGTTGSTSSTVSGKGSARPATVTLLTGDRVTVVGGHGVSVRPGPGRDDMTFVTRRDGDRLTVLPRDVVPLVRSGRVDARLFDVTGLIAAGYDDARRSTLPLLVRYQDGTQRRAAVAGTRVTRDLPAIGGVAMEASKDRAGTVWAALGAPGTRADAAGGVERIWLDGRRQVNLDRSVAQIGAPAAHRDGWTGRGVRVAVLDTGVDTTHPDLVGRVAESRDFTDRPEEGDPVGHGTHVAAIIAATGAAADGRYRGVAPEATLLSGRVCESEFCTESAILAGMQWAAVDQRATVINMSLGGYDTAELDPMEEAVEKLTAQTGALFVISAGNSGMDATVGSPGSADSALTVGAVDHDENLADFSSRGPRPYDDAIKPDITAPGVGIVAAKSGQGHIGDPVGERHVSLSGTSMAAPHVAGAAAILAQQRPDADAGQLKALLMGSARPHPRLTVYAQGAGRVDVAAAVNQRITSDPPSVSFGRTLWPHDDDTPVDRKVTYHNSGDSPVTLHLSVEVTGPDGSPAPAGMFRLGAEQVTVAAGGRAEVTVTADTSVNGPDGYYTGRVVARSDAGTVATPLAVHREVESYQLTVEVLDETGTRTADHMTDLYGLDTWHTQGINGPGPVTARMPKGQYGVASLVFASELRGFTLLAQPELTLDRDTRITIDARRGGVVRQGVPEKSAVPAMVDLAVHFRTAEGGGYGFGVGTSDFTNLRLGQISGRAPGVGFVTTVASQWVHRDTEPSPYQYSLSEAFPAAVPNGFVRDYGRRDLAVVDQRLHGDPTVESEKVVFPREGGTSFAAGMPIAATLPTSRVEYYNTAPGLRWWSMLETGERGDSGWLENGSMYMSAPVAYQPRQRYRDQWNAAPYGPALPDLGPAWGIARYGDELVVDLPLHSDAHGHVGYSQLTAGRTVLYRNGERIGESGQAGMGWFTLPPEPAEYRVEVYAERDHTDLSTEVAATYTFRSAHTPDNTPPGQSAMTVRFAPKLDASSAAPAGRSWTIPMTVQRQPDAPAAQVTGLTVDVSYDGGRTWQPTRLRKKGSGWTATVQHPAGPGWVTLRATATASDGGRVTQQITQAYRLR